MSPSIPETDLRDLSNPLLTASDHECDGMQHRRKRGIQDTAGKSGFLGLPGEVRNTISRYAITTDKWINPSDKKPGLLFVNRQLRSETERLYFMENKFELDQDIMLSDCAIAALLQKFQPLNAMNVFIVLRWSFAMPVFTRQRSDDYQKNLHQMNKNCQELLNFLTSSGPTAAIEYHYYAAGDHDRQVRPFVSDASKRDWASATAPTNVSIPKFFIRVNTHPAHWKGWIEALVPAYHAEWEIEMDLVGRSKSSYRNRVKFRKSICKALKTYVCQELANNGYRVIGIWNKGKDGSRPSFTIKPVVMQPLERHMASSNPSNGGRQCVLL